MKVGDAIPTPNIRAYHSAGWSEYRAPKGEHFVFLLLGTKPKDGDEAFNHEAALNRLGWYFDETGEANMNKADQKRFDHMRENRDRILSQSGVTGHQAIMLLASCDMAALSKAFIGSADSSKEAR